MPASDTRLSRKDQHVQEMGEEVLYAQARAQAQAQAQQPAATCSTCHNTTSRCVCVAPLPAPVGPAVVGQPCLVYFPGSPRWRTCSRWVLCRIASVGRRWVRVQASDHPQGEYIRVELDGSGKLHPEYGNGPCATWGHPGLVTEHINRSYGPYVQELVRLGDCGDGTQGRLVRECLNVGTLLLTQGLPVPVPAQQQ